MMPLLYLTGSYPPLLKGLHRSMRQIVIKEPRKAPYFAIASMPYCEQVGRYLQDGGSPGEINLRYPRISQIKNRPITSNHLFK